MSHCAHVCTVYIHTCALGSRLCIGGIRCFLAFIAGGKKQSQSFIWKGLCVFDTGNSCDLRDGASSLVVVAESCSGVTQTPLVCWLLPAASSLPGFPGPPWRPLLPIILRCPALWLGKWVSRLPLGGLLMSWCLRQEWRKHRQRGRRG